MSTAKCVKKKKEKEKSEISRIVGARARECKVVRPEGCFRREIYTQLGSRRRLPAYREATIVESTGRDTGYAAAARRRRGEQVTPTTTTSSLLPLRSA